MDFFLYKQIVSHGTAAGLIIDGYSVKSIVWQGKRYALCNALTLKKIFLTKLLYDWLCNALVFLVCATNYVWAVGDHHRNEWRDEFLFLISKVKCIAYRGKLHALPNVLRTQHFICGGLTKRSNIFPISSIYVNAPECIANTAYQTKFDPRALSVGQSVILQVKLCIRH